MPQENCRKNGLSLPDARAPAGVAPSTMGVMDKLSEMARSAMNMRSESMDARIAAESQKRYEVYLRDVESVFPSASTVILCSKYGDVLARHPRPPSVSRPPVDDSQFEDIPAEVRALDDAMTAGDMEFQELLVGLTVAARVSRTYVTEALTPDRPTITSPTVPTVPLFRTVGANVAFWIYAVDADHLLAFHTDAAAYAIDSTETDKLVAAVTDNIRTALKGAAMAPRPVPRRPKPRGVPDDGPGGGKREKQRKKRSGFHPFRSRS